MEVMKFKGAAEFLGVSERALRENWKSWGINARKAGKYVLFSKRELIGWVESQQGRLTPANEVNNDEAVS